ncbi:MULTISPECIES: sulfotransferase [unclassified Streptomyces]|uniref:sulfotransferase family protein n=1 Tax=unclassified Streptomyces TaxID=2593676 RepID=UPI0034278D98
MTSAARSSVLRNAPVLVAGYPRSGTTLLYRMLARYPEFGAAERARTMGDSAHETALSFFMSPLLDLDRIGRQGWPHWQEALGGAAGLDAYLARLGRPGRGRTWLERALGSYVFGDRVFEQFTSDVDSVAVRGWSRADRRLRIRYAAMRISRRTSVVREFLELAARSGGSERVLDKFPFHYYRFAELSAALPEARFVFIHRSPVDVFASMVHRARTELAGRPPMGSVAWLVMSAPAFVRDWCDSARAARAFAAYAPDRLLIVDYDRLTAPAERTDQVTRLARYLGLPPEVMLADAGGDPKRDPSKRFPLSSSTPTPNTRPFTDELSANDIAAVEEGCRAHAELLRAASG